MMMIPYTNSVSSPSTTTTTTTTQPRFGRRQKTEISSSSSSSPTKQEQEQQEEKSSPSIIIIKSQNSDDNDENESSSPLVSLSLSDESEEEDENNNHKYHNDKNHKINSQQQQPHGINKQISKHKPHNKEYLDNTSGNEPTSHNLIITQPRVSFATPQSHHNSIISPSISPIINNNKIATSHSDAPQSKLDSSITKRQALGLFSKLTKPKHNARPEANNLLISNVDTIKTKENNNKVSDFDQVLVSNNTRRVTLTPAELTSIDNRTKFDSMASTMEMNSQSNNQIELKNNSSTIPINTTTTNNTNPELQKSINSIVSSSSSPCIPTTYKSTTNHDVALASIGSIYSVNSSGALLSKFEQSDSTIIRDPEYVQVIANLKAEIQSLKKNYKEANNLNDEKVQNLTSHFQTKISGLEKDLLQAREALRKMTICLNDAQEELVEQSRMTIQTQQIEKEKWQVSKQIEIDSLQARWNLELESVKEKVKLEMSQNASLEMLKVKAEYEKDMNTLRNNHTNQLTTILSSKQSQETFNTNAKITAELESMVERIESRLKGVEIIKERIDSEALESLKIREKEIISREIKLSSQLNSIQEREGEYALEKSKLSLLISSLQESLKSEQNAREIERQSLIFKNQSLESQMMEIQKSIKHSNERLLQDRNDLTLSKQDFMNERRRIIDEIDNERRLLIQEKAILECREKEVQEKELDSKVILSKEVENLNQEKAWIEATLEQIRRREISVSTESSRLHYLELSLQSSISKLEAEKTSFEFFKSQLENEAIESRNCVEKVKKAQMIESNAYKVYNQVEELMIQVYNEREVMEEQEKKFVEERLKLAEEREEFMRFEKKKGISNFSSSLGIYNNDDHLKSTRLLQEAKSNLKRFDEWDSIEKRLNKAVKKLPMGRRDLNHQVEFLSGVEFEIPSRNHLTLKC